MFRSKLNLNMQLLPFSDCGKNKILDTSVMPFVIRDLKNDDYFSVLGGENHYYESFGKLDIHQYGPLSKALFASFSFPGVPYSETLHAIHQYRCKYFLISLFENFCFKKCLLLVIITYFVTQVKQSFNKTETARADRKKYFCFF